jgi:hypothetical protein
VVAATARQVQGSSSDQQQRARRQRGGPWVCALQTNGASHSGQGHHIGSIRRSCAGLCNLRNVALDGLLSRSEEGAEWTSAHGCMPGDSRLLAGHAIVLAMGTATSDTGPANTGGPIHRTCTAAPGDLVPGMVQRHRSTGWAPS